MQASDIATPVPAAMVTPVPALPSHPNVRPIISTVLDIEDCPGWEIYSSIPAKNLYLVHYASDADIPRFGHLRGVVVDTARKIVVCKSYGFTPTVVLPYLTPISTETGHCLRLTDITGREHVVDNYEIRYGHESTMMRVFKHDGVVYYASHRKIDSSRSHWGDSPTFRQIYKDLQGPSEDQLFDPAASDCNSCHLFLMVHPSILIAGKDQLGPGYMVYLGAMKVNDAFSGGENARVSSESRTPPTMAEAERYLNMTTPVLLQPAAITIEQANKHLRYGVYNPYDDSNTDPRLLPGEFVLIYRKNAAGEITSLLRVQSIGYTWRVAMRNNNPNLYHQFCCLCSDASIRADTPEGYAEFIDKYPLLAPYQPHEIQEHLRKNGPFIAWPQYSCDLSLRTRNERIINIWSAFLMAVPLHRQVEVSKFVDRFMTERTELIEWLKDIAEQAEQTPSPSTDIPPAGPASAVLPPVGNSSAFPPNPLVNPRVQQIISQARKFALERQQRGTNKSYEGKVMPYRLLVKDNIRNLIMKEEGPSLYRLIRERKNHLAAIAAATNVAVTDTKVTPPTPVDGALAVAPVVSRC